MLKPTLGEVYPENLFDDSLNGLLLAASRFGQYCSGVCSVSALMSLV